MVESDRLAVAFHRVRGGMNVRDKALGRHMLHLSMPEVGPPFGQFRPTPEIYEAHTHRADGAVHLTTRQQYDRYAGLTMERTVVVTAGMLEVRHRLINSADHATNVKVRAQSYGAVDGGHLTIPIGEGLIRHRQVGSGEWPRWGELRASSDQFGESWAAADDDGAVVGVVWQGDAQIDPHGGGGAEVTYDMLSVPPGEARELPPLYFVVGPGDHRTVRAVWRDYVCPRSLVRPQEREPDKREVLRCSLDDSPIILTGQSLQAEVELRSEERRPVEGHATLTLPRIAQFANGERRSRFPVSGLVRGTPLLKPFSIRTATGSPTAALGTLRLKRQRDTVEFPVPVIVASAGGQRLDVDESDDIVTVDTGVMQFRVSAQHGGSIVSLQRDGVELIRSSYPTPHAYHWMNPWYGGIYAQAAHPWDRRTHEATRSAEPVEVTGTTGIRWQGAKVRTVYTHKDWRWLRCDAHYLTLPGSNLLALLVTATNRASASMSTRVSVNVWPQGKKLRAHAQVDKVRRSYRADEHEYSVRSEGWLGLECGRGKVLALVGGRGPSARVELENMGDGQLHSGAGWQAQFTTPVRTFSALAWVAACGTVDEACAYGHLKGLRELP